jgi:DNA-binding MarR family transcriptional regulator
VVVKSLDGREPTLRDKDLPSALAFLQVLWAVVHGLERASKRMSAEVGVTGPQRLVLRIVGLSPGISAGALAATLHVHPSTLTGVLQRLVDQQLLSRLEHHADRRRAVLRLTSRGTRINRLSRGTVEAAVTLALRRISARDRATARRVLQFVAEALIAGDGAEREKVTSESRRRGTPSKRVPGAEL